MYLKCVIIKLMYLTNQLLGEKVHKRRSKAVFFETLFCFERIDTKNKTKNIYDFFVTFLFNIAPYHYLHFWFQIKTALSQVIGVIVLLIIKLLITAKNKIILVLNPNGFFVHIYIDCYSFIMFIDLDDFFT